MKTKQKQKDPGKVVNLISGSLKFIRLLRVVFSWGVITTRSNRMKFRLDLRPNFSGSNGYLFVSPCPPECNFRSETKVEPDLRSGGGELGSLVVRMILAIVTSRTENRATSRLQDILLFYTISHARELEELIKIKVIFILRPDKTTFIWSLVAST